MGLASVSLADPIAPAEVRPPVGPPTSRTPTGDLPTIRYTRLHRAGDTVSQALNRLTAPRVVVLPSGFDGDIVDFSNFDSFGLYNPNLLGIGGPGPENARLRLAPMSSTHASAVPAQGSRRTNQLFLVRIGRVRGTPAVAYGFTLEGSNQPSSENSEGGPHNYHGLLPYRTGGAVWENLRLLGASYGTWNSPPGETFSIAELGTTDSLFRNIEVDGRNADGRYGGSPFGANNATNIRLEDCYFHHSKVSGLTFSFAGSHTDVDKVTRGVTTRRVKVAHNANITLEEGKRFTGFNHENVMGPVRHYSPDIQRDHMTEWNLSHMSFANALSDNPDIQIVEPTWHESAPNNNGCFTVSMSASYAGAPNRQITPPTVVKNGVTLIPYLLTGAPPAPISVDPTTHFVVVRG